MASSHKIIAVCLCLMLASFGVLVEGGGGMMGGMFGGGGGKHGGGGGGLEALLAAGILAKLLGGHGHGGHGHGGYSHGRSAGSEVYAMPHGYEMGPGY